MTGVDRREAIRGLVLAPFAAWLGRGGGVPGPAAGTLGRLALVPHRPLRRAEIGRKLFEAQELGPWARPGGPLAFRPGYVLDDVPAGFAGVSILLAPSGVRVFEAGREIDPAADPRADPCPPTT